MIVDLESKTESGTFELKGGGKVHLRLISVTDMREIREACVKKMVEYPLLGEGADRKYHRFETADSDPELFNEMLWDRGITGWDDIYDRNEQPVPVNKENKILLMTRVPAFHEAVENGFKALKEAEAAKADTLQKN
jgi:hypothetical protein